MKLGGKVRDPHAQQKEQMTNLAPFSEAFLNWDLHISPEVARDTRLECRHYGDVRISSLEGGVCRGARSEIHNALDGGEYTGLVTLMRGNMLVSTEGVEMELSEGDTLIWSNRGNHEFHVNDWVQQLIIIVPTSRFQTYMARPLPFTQLALQGKTPVGGLISGFMRALSQNIELLDRRSGETAVDMFLAMLSKAIKGTHVNVEATPRAARYDRILSFIEDHLENAKLTPALIARAHNISTRYLNFLFHQHGETVIARIRERRLVHCAKDLQESQDALSITEIAHKWHFSDGAHFTRSFKAKFGVTPSAWRRDNRPTKDEAD